MGVIPNDGAQEKFGQYITPRLANKKIRGAGKKNEQEATERTEFMRTPCPLLPPVQKIRLWRHAVFATLLAGGCLNRGLAPRG
jgi:hypothetical protein